MVFDLGKESCIGCVRLDGNGDEEETVMNQNKISRGPSHISSVLEDRCV